jgi:hypothetical protein
LSIFEGGFVLEIFLKTFVVAEATAQKSDMIFDQKVAKRYRGSDISPNLMKLSNTVKHVIVYRFAKYHSLKAIIQLAISKSSSKWLILSFSLQKIFYEDEFEKLLLEDLLTYVGNNISKEQLMTRYIQPKRTF